MVNEDTDKGLLLSLGGISLEREEDIERLVKDSERQELIESITHELGLKHPITFDTYDLCEYYHRKKAFRFQCSNA